MANVEALKAAVAAAVDATSADLNGISASIWNNPELGYEEHQAHNLLTTYLESQGFTVERKYLLDTAFRASVGCGSPHVAVLCEYDALPGIGHACGHNLIAEVGVAAGLGIKAAMKSAGVSLGKLSIIGTPAEEDGAGKCKLIEAGAFLDVDFAMMAHPYFSNMSRPPLSSSNRVTITFKGKASHAAAAPWDGVNALDAAVMAYNAVSCMRQQMKPTWNLTGIISNGGERPNIIPEETSLQYCIRVRAMRDFEIIRTKFENCTESAAKATGCTVEYLWDDLSYQTMINNDTLCSLYEKNASTFGWQTEEYPENIPLPSTDMGNVSHVIPALHPLFRIGTEAPNHTKGFTVASGDPKAQPYTLTQGKLLAMVAVDVLCNPGLVDTMKAQLQEALEKGE